MPSKRRQDSVDTENKKQKNTHEDMSDDKKPEFKKPLLKKPADKKAADKKPAIKKPSIEIISVPDTWDFGICKISYTNPDGKSFNFYECHKETGEYAHVLLNVIYDRPFISPEFKYSFGRLFRVQCKEAYDKWMKSGYNDNYIYLMHGTHNLNINSIIFNGFDRTKSKCGHFGNGIYFTNSFVKAMKYSNATKTNNYRRKYILINRVNIGKTYNFADHTGNPTLTKPPKGFDSVSGRICPCKCPEIIVYDNRRIYTEYILEILY